MKTRIGIVGLITAGVCVLLALVSLTGCKSMKKNPAGVYGSDGLYGSNGSSGGSIAMGDRFTGGTEHPGMFAPVYFDYDSAQVADTERSKIDTVSQHLKQNDSVAVIIEGNGDERGSNEYNLALGERRAQALLAKCLAMAAVNGAAEILQLGAW